MFLFVVIFFGNFKKTKETFIREIICDYMEPPLATDKTEVKAVQYKNSNNGSFSPNKIPRLIIQTNEKSKIPLRMFESTNTILNDNPEYNYLYFTNRKARDFLQTHFDKKVVNAYDKLRAGAFKADLFRYCALYILGGVYIDTGMVSKSPLRNLIRHDDTFISPEDNGTTGVYNAFICCTSKHPIIKNAIDLTLEKVENNQYGDNPLDISGPRLLSRAIGKYLGRKYKAKPDEIVVPGIRTIKFQTARTGFCTTEGRIYDKDQYILLTRYPEYYSDCVWYNTNKHYAELWRKSQVYFSPLETHQEGLMYLIKKLDRICRKNNLIYYITAGTLLGAVREGGIIKWDDDIDVEVPLETIEFLKKNTEMLKNMNIKLDFRDHIWRINGLEDDHPYIDLFQVKYQDGKWVFEDDFNTKRWPTSYFYESEIFPLKPYKFNKLTLMGPANPIPFLERLYGDWKTPQKWDNHSGL